MGGQGWDRGSQQHLVSSLLRFHARAGGERRDGMGWAGLGWAGTGIMGDPTKGVALLVSGPYEVVGAETKRGLLTRMLSKLYVACM